MTLKSGSKVTQGTDTDRSATYDSLLTLRLSRTVSEINGDFSRKSPVFSTPSVINASAEGVPLGIRYRRKESKTRMMALSDGRKSFKIDLAVLTQYRRVTDRRTDGQHATTAKTALTHSVARVKIIFIPLLTVAHV